MRLLSIALCLVAGFATGHAFLTQLLGLSGEMAPYEVVATYQGFEERLYPRRKWVTTTREGATMDPLRSPMFMTLFRYISGNNAKDMSIPMTSPVSTHVGRSPSGNVYTMGFYVPEAHQADVPSGGTEVTVEDRPQMTVLTRRFSGYANDATVAQEKEELERLIRAAGLSDVDFNNYYVAGYDPPFIPVGRRNEVWFLRESATNNEI